MGAQPAEMLAAEAPAPLEAAKGPAGRSPTRIAMDRLRADKVAMICAAVVLFFVLVAIFAGVICDIVGVDPTELNSDLLDQFTFPIVGPSAEHPFGLAPSTGYDNFARWVYGARTSLMIASFATVVSTIIGIVVGLMAGFSRGWLDRVITWTIDFFLSLPFLLVALAVAPILVLRFGDEADKLGRYQLITLVTILSVFGWMGLARLIRGEVLSLREREFVQAARVIGVPTRDILFKELLPNMLAPIVVSISLGLPAYVTLEAGLAYLGVGVTGKPSWGQTVNDATAFFASAPAYLWQPVLGILALVVALNLLGDSVRDAFDPKTRR